MLHDHLRLRIPSDKTRLDEIFLSCISHFKLQNRLPFLSQRFLKLKAAMDLKLSRGDRFVVFKMIVISVLQGRNCAGMR